MIRIIQSDSNGSITERLSVLSAGENHVLHISSAELLDSLLSEHPAHSVGHIALSAPVRAYDPGDPVMEVKFNLVCKRFESLHFYVL